MQVWTEKASIIVLLCACVYLHAYTGVEVSVCIHWCS